MNWEIKPLEGLGDFEFGVDILAVESKMGMRTFKRVRGKTVRLSYDEEVEKNVTFLFDETKLIEFGIGRRNTHAQLLGEPVFESPKSTLEILKAKSQRVYEMNGFLIFDDFGLTLTGFHDGAVYDRAISGYEKGRWGKLLPKANVWYEQK